MSAPLTTSSIIVDRKHINGEQQSLDADDGIIQLFVIKRSLTESLRKSVGGYQLLTAKPATTTDSPRGFLGCVCSLGRTPAETTDLAYA